MSNILIARNQEQGYTLIESMGGDCTKWQVISYGGPLLAFAPEVLVIIAPCESEYSKTELAEMERWFMESVHQIIARAKKVVEIG